MGWGSCAFKRSLQEIWAQPPPPPPPSRVCKHLLVREEGLQLGHLAHKILREAVQQVWLLPAISLVGCVCVCWGGGGGGEMWVYLLVREEGLELGHLAHKILREAVQQVGPLPANSHVSPLEVAGGCPVAQRGCCGLAVSELEELTVPQLLYVLPASNPAGF